MRFMKTVLFSIVCCSGLQATTFSNQTYLRVRDTLDFYTPNRFMGNAKKTTANKTTFSVTGYNRSAYNRKEIGTFFAMGHEITNTLDPMNIIVSLSDANFGKTEHNDYFQYGNINYTTGERRSSASIRINPSYTEYGALFNWKQDISFLKDCSVEIEAPIVHTQTGSHPKFIESGDETQWYFNGGLTDYDSNDFQTKLNFLQINKATPYRTHIGDIKMSLNHVAYRGNDYHVITGFSALIPIAPQEKHTTLFAPQIGTGQHAGVGAYVRADEQVYRRDNAGIEIYAQARYHYLFSSKEKRTLGVYNHVLKRPAVGAPYRLLVKAGAKKSYPGANVLTKWMNVVPGNHINITSGAHFYHGALSFDASYNFFARQKEQITIHRDNKWQNNSYGMVIAGDTSLDLDAKAAGIVVGNDDYTFGGPIQAPGNTKSVTKATDGTDADAMNTPNQYYVSTDACASPADMTHTVSGCMSLNLDAFGLNYDKSQWLTNWSVSLGGNYEFSGTDGNHGMRSWSTWSKISVNF